MRAPPATATADQATTAAGDAYRRRTVEIAAAYRAIPAGTPVRLSKRTSNLFRRRPPRSGAALDVSGLDGVIHLDPAGSTVDVGAMTTYEDLVDATLPHGLVPCVVPELKTITVGGAVTGLGIESSSWRNGMPHETTLELDVLTGGGELVTARPEGEHGDLFRCFPNSYGTLGYALRVRLRLESVAPWVHVRHLRFGSVADLVATLVEVCAAGSHAGEEVAFVDGTFFDAGECYLTLGSWTDEAPPYTHDYSGEEIYYRSIPERPEDWLTVRSYLWRWDTDWFWCSRAFGVQRPWVRRLLGPRWLRSDTYWRLMAWEDRFGVKGAIDRRRGLPERERVVQDVQVPAARLAEYLEHFAREVPISPVWLCPLRQADASLSWPLYPLDAAELYVNVGFWSTCALGPGMGPDHHNRWVEDEVARLGGLKSLYSTSFYDEERFWSLYGGDAYRQVKDRYDPDRRLLDLYQKCVERR